MILDYLINWALSLITYVISLLPNADPAIVTFISSQLSTVKELLVTLNFGIDIVTFGQMLVWFLIIELALLLLHLTQWIIANVSLGIYKPTK
jgi:hypothetical protein